MEYEIEKVILRFFRFMFYFDERGAPRGRLVCMASEQNRNKGSIPRELVCERKE